MRTLMAASALAGAFALAHGAAAQTAASGPFSGETVFGDSLSDGGDISILEGLPNIMRFTTNPGLTTVEDVGGFFGVQPTASLLGGTNYAYGGAGVNTNAPGTPAGVPTVTTQISDYLAAGAKISPTELFTVFGGANDIFYHSTAYGIDQYVAAHSAGAAPSQVAALTMALEQAEGVSTTETAPQAAANMTAAGAQEVSLISSLQKAGARYIVVFNLPDVGRTPSSTGENALIPGISAEITTLSQTFNTTLNNGLKTLGVGIVPVNTYALLDEVLADPAKYGFVNSTVPACTTASSLTCTRATLVVPNAYTDYVFADGVHPTTTTHALFAEVVESEILAPQQISLLAEEPLATLEAERDAIGAQLLSDQLDPSRGVHLFATGGYVHQHYSGERYTPSAHDDDGLITAGVDDRLSAAVTLGAEISGGTASESLNGQLRRFDTDAVMGSVFAQYVLGHAYVDEAAGYGGLNFHDIRRQFEIGPATRVESGDTSGRTSSASITGGYWFGSPTLRVGPVAELAYERVHVDRYGEKSGDSTAMLFEGQTRESLIGRLGARLQGDLPFAGVVLRPYGELAYAYDGDARTRDVTAGLTTMAGEFAIPGFSPDRQWGEVKAGLDAAFSPRWSGYVAFNGRFAGRTTDYDGADVGVRYAF